MVLRDISERKLAEKRVSEFYSMVSHELRTPLTSIRASLGLMQGGVAGDLSEMSRQLVDIGREECDRLIRLINDILDIRKIEAGKMELKLREVQPRELVQIALEGMKSVADEVGIELESPESAKGLVTCDQDRILQVLTNLISNAIKFSSPGKGVAINTEWVDSEWLRFSVIDKGSGIPADHVPKLFQKFQQLDQSDTRSKGGTGLGLAICKAIVDEHHGRIGVHTELGEGSTFYFELPREQPEKNNGKH
jgi:signal transduction histidine kinase